VTEIVIDRLPFADRQDPLPRRVLIPQPLALAIPAFRLLFGTPASSRRFATRPLAIVRSLRRRTCPLRKASRIASLWSLPLTRSVNGRFFTVPPCDTCQKKIFTIRSHLAVKVDKSKRLRIIAGRHRHPPTPADCVVCYGSSPFWRNMLIGKHLR